MKKLGIFSLAFIASAAILGGCNTENNNFSKCSVYPVDYGEVKVLTDKDEIPTFMTSIGTDNRPSEEGIISSPYFSSLTINNVEVPIYGTRTANTLHSFAYVDIEQEDLSKPVKLEVKVVSSEMKKKFKKVEVLPLKSGVVAEMEEKTITATISEVGNYSFVFDGKQAEALTLMIAHKDKKENHLQVGDVTRVIQEIEPGKYFDDTNLKLTEINTLYFFKKGVYEIGQITIPDNSALYFEEGTFLQLHPDGKAPLTCNEVSNIGIYGHGFVDYSWCNGSQLNPPKETQLAGKGGISLNNSNNVEIHGLMINNAQTWQCCLNCCTNIHIENCMFYGYRTYADGIMLNNCQDAIVEHNFIRTGDDAFETKSTSGNMLTKNVVFQYNSAWTDKASAYGTIYESKNDTTDVHFLHNSVGFASGNWNTHLGCALVEMGDNPNAKIHDIEFDDMEIYYSCNQGMCNIFIGGSGGQGEGSGTVDKIYFKNIKCYHNMSYMLSMTTWDEDNCYIGKVYMENIESNGIKLTTENYKDYCSLKGVAGGYSPQMLSIDGTKCK